MMNVDVNKDKIQENIASVLSKIKEGRILSEIECIKLKEQINGLPLIKNIEIQGDDILGIDDLLNEFNSYAKQSSEKLEKMLITISEGRVPSKDEKDAFDRTIEQLSKRYNQVCIIAKSTLQDDEMPDDDSPISVYYEAIKNSKHEILKKKLAEIDSILHKFISVKSMVENLMVLLQPFQDDAKSLLLKIESEEITDVDEISSQIEAHRLFVKAIECEDIDSDEGEEILDSLDELGVYQPKITRGLSKRQYYLSKDYFETIETDEKEEPIVIPEEENKHDNTPECTSTSTKITSEVKHSEFTNKIINQGLLLEEKDFGNVISDVSPAEEKKISASVFSNDLRKGNLKVTKTIIKHVDDFLIVSPETLELQCGMPKEIAKAGLEFLKGKGYLRKYKLLPDREFYCCTSRLDKSLESKEASKLVGVKQHQTDKLGKPIEDKASSVTARLVYLEMYNINACVFKAKKVKKTASSNILLTDAFIYKVLDFENPKYSELYIGLFWTSEHECDDFIKLVKEKIKKSDNIEKFILCSINAQLAKKYTEIILEENIEGLEESIVYLFSLNDDSFYKFDLTPIKSVEIWPELNKKSDDEKDDVEELKEDDVKYNPKEITDENESLESSEIEVIKHVKGVDREKKTTSIVEKDQSLHENLSVDMTICKLINAKKYYCVPAYVKAMCLKNESYTDLYEQVAFALNDPMRHCIYSANSVFDIISTNTSVLSEYFVVSIGLRTFFSNQVRYDYSINALYNAIKDLKVLSDYPALSSVMYKLFAFKNEHKKGLDAYADYKAKSAAQLDEELKKIISDAKIFYDSTIAVKKSEKTNQRRFLETKKMMFDVNGDIGQYINAVAENEKDIQPLVVDFLQENFIREGNVISEDNIDSDLLWDYIMGYWKSAGEKMMMKLRADLKSHLRSNIINSCTRAIQILIRWCNVVDKLKDRSEDAGSKAYKKIRKPLLSDIQESIDFIEKYIRNNGTLDEEVAGLEIIIYTLNELNKCIKGTFEEYEKKFFYVPFLLTDHVLLDERFYPDLSVHSSEIAELQPEYRILSHADYECVSPTKRFDEILKDGGDDYGSAKLLLEYVETVSPKDDYNSVSKNIEEGEAYAKETAELRKEQFIGDLELAQSYGQIDNSNSKEDKKEKILQIVNEWYDCTLENSNYGFFERVMDSYLAEIRREAKSREKDLISQLDLFKASSIKGISTEVKEKKITKIQTAIDQQNYTVAEDLLARVDRNYDDIDEIIEETFLRDFLDDYNDYYKIVSKGQNNLSTLIKNRTYNKEERGGKRLADNWLPGGSYLGSNRLVGLLNGLGFKVDDKTVLSQTPIGKFENYLVKTISAQGGKRENYTHPIAAFGSGAAQEGFRVVCLNGKYDAANLIDVMKQIGNAKHTMILLDYALDKPERRILARKSKSDLGDKLFVVIDRTVMMYIIKNYDETKVNRMLMSLITPFGYYQPYVWESSNVMPPEIFMGRKHELERIESASGANIVYGGRQLGKSALLKKAKLDIDKDENGDRAVLVDVKGLNYREVAEKIGHALYDEGILKEDTKANWDDLARAIKKRLQSEKDYIPYLLLLIDEADVFIESCKEVNYRPFDCLKDIQGIGVGRFKFVIAGLRNVVRLQRDAALGNNSVLTHLEAMTVKPFQATEARELMEIPLHYLGLEFPKENEALITLILATANYFPGLIQMYCAKLLLAMRNKDYAGYDEADTPIYEISEEHIKKVLADPEFMEQIREKFFITLKLDEDNYYYLIALIMAFLYHNNGYNDGYSPDDIKNIGKELEITKIANLDNERLQAFMEELKELNVFRSTDNSHYLFTRYTFFQMMGTKSEIDDKLEEYMED